MIAESVRIGLARGVLVGLFSCRPHLLRLLQTMAAMISGPLFDSEWGAEIPVVMLPDRGEQQKIGSPLSSAIGSFDVPDGLVPSLRALLPDPPPVLTMTANPEAFQKQIGLALNRIASAGLADVATLRELAPVLDDGLIMDIPAGLLLIGRGMAQQTTYLVLDGHLEIGERGRPIATCGVGRYVGEVAFLLKRLRTQDVHAGPQGARVLAFGIRSLARETTEAGPFWRSVATDLATKLADMSGHVE